MKRLCIYVIYDKQQKINPYIELVLKELKKYVTDIVVVCNFESIVSGQEYLTPYAKEIYCRKNIGFDAGAYKDAIINLITWKSILEYDELILTNDTYFAPIYPFDNMFQVMDEQKCDFWGITKSPKGKVKSIGEFDAHIQSYFLCFKNNLFHSNDFRKYWNEYVYGSSREETILKFELGINEYLFKKGYIGSSYMECNNFLFEYEDYTNPYHKQAYELIRDIKLPILKKANFNGNSRWLSNSYKALKYINSNTDYDIDLISSYLKEYQEKGLMGTYYDFKKMEQFVEVHKNIYIYGSGKWGLITADYFEEMSWDYKGFVVTNPNEKDMVFSELKLNEEDGIIIAQEYKSVCDEILEYIGERCNRSQIFTPCYVE